MFVFFPFLFFLFGGVRLGVSYNIACPLARDLLGTLIWVLLVCVFFLLLNDLKSFSPTWVRIFYPSTVQDGETEERPQRGDDGGRPRRAKEWHDQVGR